MGLTNIKNHTELFLEFSRNAEFYDTKTGLKDVGEIYPILAPNGDMSIHFIYPHVFKTTAERNLHKLDILKKQKQKGINYFLKGTLEVVDSAPEILNFFSDRHFVITKRRNLIEYTLSFLVAWVTRIFHARRNNKERYQSILNSGVTIPIELMMNDLDQFLKYTFYMWDLESYIKTQGWEHTTTYYEDLEDFDSIQKTLSTILNDPNWMDCLPPSWADNVPIKIPKDYSEIITNYDQVVLIVTRCISKIRPEYLTEESLNWQ